MKGLLLKDFFNLKKTISMYFSIIAIFIVYCVLSKRNVFLPIVPVLIFSTMITGAFTKDNDTKWDKLAITMPVSRSKIVQSRYVLFVAILLIGFLLGALSMIIPITSGNAKPLTAFELLLLGTQISIFAGCTSMMLLYSSKNMIDKVELVTIISYLVGVGLALGITQLAGLFTSSKLASLIIGTVVGLLLLIISYKISVYAFIKKDFD